MLKLSWVTFLLFIFNFVYISVGLEQPENFSEGSCSINPPTAIRANRAFVDSLQYISGGGKYFIYNLASSLPNYSEITEEELYSNACITRNTSTIITPSISVVTGFGQPLASFQVFTRPGIYLEGIPTDPSKAWNTLRVVVTFTDHKTFAVIRSCNTGVDQRSWILVSLTPKISPWSRKMILEHVAATGDSPENFLFLGYDKCKNIFQRAY